jgi:hypothetical protein
VPTATPKATATPVPTATPKPTATATPKPTATPDPDAYPVPNPTVTPTATPKPTATPTPAANQPPIVELTQPTSGTSLLVASTDSALAGANQVNATATSIPDVALKATARDNDGRVVRVEFWANGAKIADATKIDATNWGATWKPLSTGTYHIKARAYDDDNALTDSTEVVFSIGGSIDRVELPIADAFVRGGSMANQNFGTGIELISKRSPGNLGAERETWLRFNISNVDESALSEATLRIRGASFPVPRISCDIVGLPDAPDWGETALTWNTRHKGREIALGAFTFSLTSPGVLEWDVSDAVRAARAAGKSSVTLIIRGRDDTFPYARIDSREAGTSGGMAPQLVLKAGTAS